MKKVIIKLKGEDCYWREETFGTTKDINEAHHYDESKALGIINSFSGGFELIDIPNTSEVTIRTRDRYWTGYFGKFTEDRSEAAVYSREFAENLTRNYSEDTVVEDIDIAEKDKFKGGWGPGGYLERPINEFEELIKIDPEVYNGIFEDRSDNPSCGFKRLKQEFSSLDLSDWDISGCIDHSLPLGLKPEYECIKMADSCDCGAYTINKRSEDGVQGKFEGILTSLNSLLEYKNKKYGNVALEPLNIFAKYGGIGQRLDDKLSRIKNAEELRKNDVADMLGYLVLLCKEHGFENFDEFKD